MRNILKKTTALALILALLIAVVPPVTVNAVTVSNVGALWDSFTAGSGTFTVTENSRLFVAAASEPTGDLLQTAQLLQSQLMDEFEEKDAFTELVWGDKSLAKAGDIILVLDTASGTGADGYALNVNATTATVTAADTDGLIYGTNNLMKCFRAVGSKSISCFSGKDTPDTKERTVHLDLARKYYTVEWVKNFIRQMSWMGYNALELHLSEDGGFRADFWDEKYYTDSYKPVNDFSWLCGSHVQYWVHGSYVNDPNAGDYLYTEELVDICNTAKEYHIEIIPSFDSPAHMDYITWKFEQNYKSNKDYYFSYGGKDYFASATSGCINYKGVTGGSAPGSSYTTMELDNDNQRGQMAKAFVFALYEDMADFFKEYAGSSKFMIGGDEVGLSSSTWAYSDFVTYVNELNSKLKAKGYTVRMYNDFIGSTIYNSTIQYGFGKAVYGADSANGFDRDIEIVYWNSDFNPSTGSSNASTGNYTWHVKFFWENNTGTTDNWGDGGRTMYNAAQTYTYYVLRAANSTSSTRDARNPNNRNWTFYRSTEEHIYNEWYPADISERGDYSENAADVPADQLGGAYFLIWNDYAAVSTEKQVWEGAPDVANSSTKYYLLDRMASNIIKMWNADVNSSVSYTEFAAVRDAVNEDFPGFTSCSADAYLPEASEITEATETVDKSALIAALNNVIQVQGNFTDDSWSKYQAAIDAAEIVRDDEDATQDEVDAALDALIAAEKALVSVDKSALKAAIDAALTDQGVYTDESWSAYQAALSAAKAVYEDGNATQAQVDKALNDLKAAKDALKEKDPGSSTDPTDPPTEGVTGSILKVEKVTKTARLGKQVGLRITTSADVQNITVEGEKLTICTCSKAQNLNGFEGQVKVWLIGFPADQTGEFTYNIAADNGGSAVVNITVK